MNTYKMKLEDSVDSMIFDLLEVPIVDKDVEGAVDNTTVDGNVFTDYLWLKKNYVQKWSIMCDDEYSQLRGFYTRQFDNASVPTYKLYTGQNLSEDFIASGKYIMVNNTTDYNAPINSFELLGDAEQTTYSGKNLADSSTENFVPYNSAVSETNGVLKMTADAGVLARMPLALPELTGGTTYAISFEVRGVSIADGGTFVRVRETSGGGSWISSQVNIGVSSSFTTGTIVFTPSSTVSPYLWFYLSTANTNTTNVEIYVKNIQLEAGSTATAYEPYVGGTASPNPDYPQTVNTVTGEQTVKIAQQGKNLADPQIFVDWVNNMKGLCQIYGWGNDTTQPQITTYDGKTNVASVDSSTLYTKRNDMTNPTYEESLIIYKGIFEANTAYTISFKFQKNNTSGATNLQFHYTDGTNGSLNIPELGSGWTSASFTSSALKTLESIKWTYSSGRAYIDLDTLQIEKGTTATSYEPFISQTLKVNLGKNLLHISHSSATVTVANISTTSNDDGTITLNGTGNANGWLEFVYAFQNGTTQQTTPTIKLDATATYTLSSTVLSGTITGAPFITIQKDASSSGTTANVGASVSFTGSDGIYRGFVRVASGQVFDNAKIGIQLEKGTQATTYTPFMHTSRNLFNKDTANTANGYLSGTTGAFVSGGGSYATQNATFLTAGNYIASQTLEKVCHYAMDDSFIGLLERSGSNNEKFTMPEDGYVRLQFASSFNANTFQLEAGTVSTPYESYYAQLELVKIGTYQDYIFNDNGTWKIHKEIDKAIYDGSSDETWGIANSGTASWFYYTYLPYDNSTIGVTAMSNLGVWANISSGSQGIFPVSNKLTRIRLGEEKTTADWRTFLASTNMIIYYALATPYDTEITNQALIDQLNAIQNAYLYTGINNISNSSVNLAGDLDLGYTLIYEKENIIIPQTSVRLTLTDGGVINVCGCRQNVQLGMRETIQ